MMTSQEAWTETLTRLQGQMTAATFNTWLKGSRLLEAEEGLYRVGVRNEYAKDWIDHRLYTVLCRTLAEVVGEGARVEVVVRPEEEQQALPGLEPKTNDGQLPPDIEYPNFNFNGFDVPKANYIQVPKDLVYQVLPWVRPTVNVLMLMVLAETVGVIVDGRGSRREEWIATYSHIRLVCNMGRSSVYTAVWEARAHGLLVQRLILEELERGELARLNGLRLSTNMTLMGLRPRWRDEAIDYPLEPRPER